MPTQRRKQKKWLVIAAAVLLTATPSFALFGIGDIVFDPTSYASLIQQLTTLQMQYNMVKNNITHFSLKQQWQTTLHKLENANVANMFGETAGTVAAFRADRKAMERLVAADKTDLHAQIPHGDGQTILREALLVADHNAYHLGQLVLLRRLLGAWPD